VPFETYPLPGGKPSIDAVQERIAAQHQQIMDVLPRVFGALDGALLAQDRSLNGVQSKIIRALNGRIKAQNGLQQPVNGNLYNAMATAVAEQGSQLAVQQAVLPRIAPTAPPTIGSPPTVPGGAIAPMSVPSAAPIGASTYGSIPTVGTQSAGALNLAPQQVIPYSAPAPSSPTPTAATATPTATATATATSLPAPSTDPATGITTTWTDASTALAKYVYRTITDGKCTVKINYETDTATTTRWGLLMSPSNQPGENCQAVINDWDRYGFNSPGWTTSGPWDHRPTDAEVIKACCGSVATAPPPPTGGTGSDTTPITPPTQPTGNGTTPTPTVSWFAVCLADGTTTLVPGTDANSALIIAGEGSVILGGPYANQDDANADIAAKGLKCGPIQECQIKPLIPCPTAPAGFSGFGTPGTAEWCRSIDQTVQALGSVGVSLFKFIDDLLNAKTRIDNIDEYLKESGIAPVTNGIVKVIRQVFCWLAPLIETLRQSLTCFRQWMQILFPKCNNEALWGMLVIRSFLLALQRFEFGTDAALWFIGEAGMSLDPLLSTLNYLINYACPVELMSEAGAIEAYKYNNLDENTARCILAAHGRQWEGALPEITARGDKPNWKELIQYVRRFGMGDDAEKLALRNLGVLDPSYNDVLREVYNELPSIGDHLEWLRKNVFDTQYVKDFQMMDGFGNAQDLAEAGFSGYVDAHPKPYEHTFWGRFGGDLNALGMKKEYAALHYAAHWINPSFSQQFDMVQRLRPGRVDPSLVFSRDDLLRTMQEMDVGVYFRERLERVSHPVPNLTLCLQMYQFGTVDDGEFIEKLKDLGFDDANAAAILAAQRIKVRRLNASAGHGWTPSALASAYGTGRITAEVVKDEMTTLGYSADEANALLRRAEIELINTPLRRVFPRIIQTALSVQDSAYKCGSISAEQLAEAYKSAGIPDKVSRIGIANVDSGLGVELCRQQIGTFRQALLGGKITVDQLRLLMEGLGIPAHRVDGYLQSWTMQLKVKAPAATAGQILRWASQGLLDLETAKSRLLNLGWRDPDLVLLLAETQQKLARLQQSLSGQAVKSQQAASRAALKSAQQAESLANRLRTKLRGIASRPSLQKWFKERLIDETYFIDSMKARGYDDDSTLKYLAEAEQMRAKEDAKANKETPPQATSNGTTTGQ
jgi:hypothetical protein